MVFLLCFLVSHLPNPDLVVLKQFQDPGAASNEVVRNPYSMDFDEKGRLYLLDSVSNRVLIWRADGRFYKAFGRGGDGPGEWKHGFKLAVAGQEVVVWEHRQRMQVFDLEGQFLRTIPTVGIRPRQFGFLENGAILVGYQKLLPDGSLDLVFGLLDEAGKPQKNLKTFRDESLLSQIKDGNIHTNEITIKGYGPDIDIQRGQQGHWYFGFGQEPVIYKLNGQGELVNTLTLAVPTGKPTPEERELQENMSFPGPDGARIKVKDIPGQRIDFNHDKAYYTQFTVKGDRAILLVTPLGGAYGSGNGFWESPYMIVNLHTGKPLGRGRFRFAEDSTVLLRNGRMLACTINQTDEYDLREITFKGFN